MGVEVEIRKCRDRGVVMGARFRVSLLRSVKTDDKGDNKRYGCDARAKAASVAVVWIGGV